MTAELTIPNETGDRLVITRHDDGNLTITIVQSPDNFPYRIASFSLLAGDELDEVRVFITRRPAANEIVPRLRPVPDHPSITNPQHEREQ